MEVEIKLRLLDEDAHKGLAKALEPHFRETHKQENIFYDGSEGELSKQRVIVRTRFYNTDKRCLLTIKGQQIVKDGIGRGSEVEEDIDPTKARKFLQDPQSLYNLPSDILQPILKEHGVKELKCLGGFRNERSDYDFEGFKLELDKTMFAHGTVYEVEVETEDPETLKIKLEEFLKKSSVAYKYSTTTKFANFVNKTLE